MSGAGFIRGECLVPGVADGGVTLLREPLSLWGGFDLENGKVADVNHPDYGAQIAGRVLVMPGGRGSSSSSSVLLESARIGANPVAIVLAETDPILAVGALVAGDLYGVSIPIVRVSRESLPEFRVLGRVRVYSEAGNAGVEPL